MSLCGNNNPCPDLITGQKCGITYTGARYVPLFADPAQWDNTKAYEPLTIVLNEGNSYTSKTFVPVGVDISNETYWALTGNYNAQVESYRREVQEYTDIVNNNMMAVVNVSNILGNDLTGLQDLIDKANEPTIFYLKNGNYTLPTALVLKDYIHIVGESMKTVINCEQGFVNNTSPIRYNRIKTLRLIGTSSFNGINLNGLTEGNLKLQLIDLYITGFNYAVSIYNSWDSYISRCNFSENEYGCLLDACNSGNVDRTNFYRNKNKGCILQNTLQINFTGTVQENGLTGMAILSCEAININCYAEQNGYNSSTPEGGSNIYVSNFPNKSATIGGTINAYIIGGKSSGEMVSSYGLYINYGSSLILSGNTLQNNIKDLYLTSNSNNINLDQLYSTSTSLSINNGYNVKQYSRNKRNILWLSDVSGNDVKTLSYDIGTLPNTPLIVATASAGYVNITSKTTSDLSYKVILHDGTVVSGASVNFLISY